MIRPLESYHRVWLSCHPHRTEKWLRERMVDGFDIHHRDGDKGNEDPDNLVLIEHTDHSNELHRYEKIRMGFIK